MEGLAPTEDRIQFADGAHTLEEIYATMSPTRLLAEMYYGQIGPVRREHTTQMIAARFGEGSLQTAKRAVLGVLNEKVEAGEIDDEMADIAKEEFDLIG